jgi:hypothetical protein
MAKKSWQSAWEPEEKEREINATDWARIDRLTARAPLPGLRQGR